ncbi:MAG TPA: hypothetical protein ENJ19_07630 [Gammaproteobacteria bacterium]|nr:hypothetical protein [Gammaproteobacteria bacterium]
MWAKSAWLAALILGALGLGFDHLARLNQAPLFLAFQLASLTGTGFAVTSLWGKVQGPVLRAVVVVGAFIVWRVSYFPIMVFAGWVATLGEWVAVQLDVVPVVIYPTFFLAMALMNWAAVMAGGRLLYTKKLRWAPLAVSAFAIACLVSFTSSEDWTVLPDYNFAITQPAPAYFPPVGNPYYEAVGRPQYNLAEDVLLFASGAMYSFIPSGPWSSAVKGYLEQAFRDMPKASSARRVTEHYVAFRSAQSFINAPVLPQSRNAVLAGSPGLRR